MCGWPTHTHTHISTFSLFGTSRTAKVPSNTTDYVASWAGKAPEDEQITVVQSEKPITLLRCEGNRTISTHKHKQPQKCLAFVAGFDGCESCGPQQGRRKRKVSLQHTHTLHAASIAMRHDLQPSHVGEVGATGLCLLLCRFAPNLYCCFFSPQSPPSSTIKMVTRVHGVSVFDDASWVFCFSLHSYTTASLDAESVGLQRPRLA